MPPTPASGTLSEQEPTLTFAGTTTVGINPFGATGQNPCFTGTIECDQYELTIDLPAGYAESHPDVLIRIKLAVEFNTDDYDFYLTDASGTDVAVTTGDEANVIEIAPAAGSYTISVVPVTAYLNSYTGTVQLVLPDSGGGDDEGDGGGQTGGPAYNEVPSVPGAPRVVVADIDSGINPYHDAYYHGGPVYGDSYPRAVTKEVLAAMGVKPENVVRLTRTGNIDADIASDKAFWDSVKPHELYHFVGTNIIAASYAGSGLKPLVPDTAKSAHGVGTSSAVIIANPEAVLYFLETEGDLGNDAAHDAAFLNPEVDIITTSYGVSVPYTGFPLPETRAFHDTYTGVVEMGKMHFSSGGNAPGLTPFRAGAGPWWSIGVGGIEEGSSEGDTLLSGVFPDFVSDFTQDLPYCMDCETEVDTGVAGTSFSTPRSAGVASRVLLTARRLVGHQGGIRAVDGKPVMVSGKGYAISNWFIRRALEQAAWIPGTAEYDPVAGVFDLGGLPINPAAPWAQIAWGDLTTLNEKDVVNKALGHLELGLTLNEKAVGYCDFQTAIIQERKLYWDSVAPFLPDVLGGDETGTTPEEDPFIFCENSLGMPESNDPGGEPVDTDADGVVDALDNCPAVANGGQADADNNGVGDACETTPNRAPTAVLSAPASANVGAAVIFNAAGSSDPDGDTLTYAFDFGDGGSATGSASSATHSYANAGSYTVTLSVSDGRGGSNSTQRSITVGADEPEPTTIEAKLTSNKTSGEIPLTVIFDASATTGCSGCSYTFVFGDGTQSEPQSAATISYTYTAAGTFHPYVIAVSDESQADVSPKLEITSTATVVVTPGNETVAQLVVDNARGPAPLTVKLDGSRSIAADGRSIVSYRFDFGDGTPVVIGTQAIVTHVYTVPGTYQPTLTVTDDEGEQSVAKSGTEVLPSNNGGGGSDNGGGGTVTKPSKGGGAFGLFALIPLALGAALRRRSLLIKR